MTLQEILKAQGLSDEQIQAVTGEMTKNKVFVASEENLDIRYKDLQSKFDGKEKEYKEATGLIAQLKKDNKGNEDMQGKITDYETTVSALQNELAETKLDSALKLALVEAKAVDVDYLSYKIKNGDTEITLDDTGKIKGLDDTIDAMKKQYPTQFEATAAKKVEENILPGGDPKGDPAEPKSLAEALKENYTPKDE